MNTVDEHRHLIAENESTVGELQGKHMSKGLIEERFVRRINGAHPGQPDRVMGWKISRVRSSF